MLIGSAGRAAARKKPSPSEGELGELPKPQLINTDTDPTLRFPAASFSGWSIFSTSYGWFDVSKTMIRYTPVEPASKLNEGFDSPLSEVSEMQLKMSYLMFHADRKKHTIFYVPQERWGTIHSGPGAMQAAAMGSTGTAIMFKTIRNFDQMLAQIKPPPPPEPQLSFRAEPSTVEKGHSVTLLWTSMNATSVMLEPGDKAMPTEGTLSIQPEETTTYTLVAKGGGGSKIASAMVTVNQPVAAAPPTIILVEPNATAGQTISVTSPTLKIRGVAMDATGFPVVSVNGISANMKPQNTQAAEFWSDPVSLHDGDNKFDIVAINRGQIQTRVSFNVHYAAPAPAPPPVAATAPNPKALDKPDILDLLKNYVPSSRVAELVKQYGLKFSPSESDLADIRAAGGTDELITALRQSAQAAKP